MTTYLSDRQRVELALPARMIHSVIASAAVEGDAEGERLTRLAAIASLEPLVGLSASDQAKVARRAERLYREILNPYTSNADRFVSAAKVGLIVYFLLSELIETGVLVLGDGPMREATEAVLDAIQETAEEEAVRRSAQKQAEKVLSRLREKGFYRV